MGSVMFLGEAVLKILSLTIISCSVSTVLVAASEVITELISERSLFQNSTDSVEDVSFFTYRKPVENN